MAATRFKTKADIDKLEGYWLHHDTNKRDLQYREWELLHPHKEKEEITGIRSGSISNPTANQAMVLTTDRYYQNLKCIVSVVERVYEESDDDTKKLIDMKYWDKDNNCYEWEDIADALYMSRNKVLRKRNALLDLTASYIGWV